MDFQSAMETFAEAWVAANTQTPLTEAAAAEAQALAFSRSAAAAAAESLSAAHDSMADKDSDHEFDAVPQRGSSLRSPHPDPHLTKSRIPTNTGKSIPVHCIVEQVPSPQNCDQAGEALQPTVELDSYAIIPSSTLFCELVRAGLLKLGYTQSEAIGAKGAIHIKNWKPLSFDMISDEPEATVGDILGELTTVATLRIRLYSRARVSTAHDVKEKLLQLLLTQSQNLLVNAGCPIDESLLSLISKGIIPYEITEDTRKKFDHWYLQQVMQHRQQQQQQQHQQQQQQQQVTVKSPGGNWRSVESHATPTGPQHHQQQQHHHHHPQASGQFQAGASGMQKTRMRTSFDPELELPKLHRWFAENQHPTRVQIQQYVRELNVLESRKGRKPLDVNNVVYWFKNARAAHKRAEMRQLNGGSSGSGGCHSPGHDTASSDNGQGDNGPFLANGDGTGLDNQDSNNSSGSAGRQPPASASASPSSAVPLNLSDPHRRGSSPHASNGFCKGDLEAEVAIDSQRSPARRCDFTTSHDLPRDSSSSVSVKQEPTDEEDPSPDVTDDEEEDELGTDLGEEGGSAPAPATAPRGESPHLHPHAASAPATPTPGGGQLGLSLQPPSADLAHSMLYMASYLPSAIASLEERRKRNRTFIDPVTEVPRLEQWFALNTHPSHNLILKYTDELNKMPYRQKFPKLEPKNVQFWFKNRRAKCKRLKLSL